MSDSNQREPSLSQVTEEGWSRAPTKPELPSVREEAADEVRRLRHDARGALNHIIGYTEMLVEDAEEEDERGELLSDLKKIGAAGQRLRPMVDRLAELAANQRPAQPEVAEALERPEPRRSTSEFIPHGHEVSGSILVVDDNDVNRDVLARRLRRRGYQVATAEGGAVALEMLQDGGFDLVLLDVMMPGIDGFEVLQTIRATSDPSALPVIMATARDASEDVVTALRRGANDYVTKPLDMPVVLARVAAQLSLKAARDEVHRLNSRLESAQERIARMAESSMEALQNVESWASSAANEVARELGVSGISVWITENNEDVHDVTGTRVAKAPSSQDLQNLASSGRPLRRTGDQVMPILGLSGQLFGAVVVPEDNGLLNDLDLRLLESFARQLGGALELRRIRVELNKAANRRRRRQEELMASGVEVLHLCPRCGRCYSHEVERCLVDGGELYQPPTMPLILASRYRLERVLGQGGMGMVFSARDERLDRLVAVKIVRAEHFDNDLVRLRFEKEARAVARIEHPGVVAIYDSGVLEDGGQFIVMELLEGADLGTVIGRRGSGTPREVGRMLRQTSAALSAAHHAGIIHRDIKPENIFLTKSASEEFTCRIVDFGVAKELGSTSNLTQTGMLVGTPRFMAPEQLMGQAVDARSDVYSLAAVGFYAVCGRRVTEEEELINVVLDVCQNDPPALSSIMNDVPTEIDRAFAWALARDPLDRPASAETWVASFIDTLESMPSTDEGWGDEALSASGVELPGDLGDQLLSMAATRAELHRE